MTDSVEVLILFRMIAMQSDPTRICSYPSLVQFVANSGTGVGLGMWRNRRVVLVDVS